MGYGSRARCGLTEWGSEKRGWNLSELRSHGGGGFPTTEGEEKSGNGTER